MAKRKKPSKSGQKAQYRAAANTIAELHRIENPSLTPQQVKQIEDTHYNTFKRRFGQTRQAKPIEIPRSGGIGSWRVTVSHPTVPGSLHDVAVEHVPVSGGKRTHEEFGEEIKGGISKTPRASLGQATIIDPKSGKLSSQSHVMKKLLSTLGGASEKLQQRIGQRLSKDWEAKAETGTARTVFGGVLGKLGMRIYGEGSIGKKRKTEQGEEISSSGKIITLVHGDVVKRFSLDPSHPKYIGQYVTKTGFQRKRTKGKPEPTGTFRIYGAKVGDRPEVGEKHAIAEIVKHAEGMSMEDVLKHSEIKSQLKESADAWLRSVLIKQGIKLS